VKLGVKLLLCVTDKKGPEGGKTKAVAILRDIKVDLRKYRKKGKKMIAKAIKKARKLKRKERKEESFMSKAVQLLALVEAIQQSKLNELYFAYVLLESYLSYKNYSLSKLEHGIEIRINKEIDFSKDLQDAIEENEFKQVAEKFLSKGIEIGSEDYGVPEQWPGGIVTKGKAMSIHYHLTGKGRYLGEYKLQLNSVLVKAKPGKEVKEEELENPFKA